MNFIEYLKTNDATLWENLKDSPVQISFLAAIESGVLTNKFIKERRDEVSFTTEILVNLAAWSINQVPDRDRVLFFTKRPDVMNSSWGDRSGEVRPVFDRGGNSLVINRGLTRHTNWPRGVHRISRATLVIYDDAGPEISEHAVEHAKALQLIHRLPLLGGHSTPCPVIAVSKSFAEMR